MRLRLVLFLFIPFLFACNTAEKPKDELKKEEGGFNIETDLLLANYDCKTDVDDLHSVAALASLIRSDEYTNLKYHAVAGAYGIQEGLYVPPNPLFELAFENNWTDAHVDKKAALQKVRALAVNIMDNKGDIWIAEAGQSDFSSSLLKLLSFRYMGQDLTKRVHIVQHSEWNESVTDSTGLAFVKQFADYQKIPDGNALDNGTPGFRDPDFKDWKNKINNPALLKIWSLADSLSMEYNGVDGRYLNEAIEAGGLDFSDFSEVCWILGIEDWKDAGDFVEALGTWH